MSVTASGPVSPQGHMKPSSTVDLGWIVAFWEHSVLKLIEIVILCVYYTIPFGFSLFWHFLTTIFNFKTTLFCKGSMTRVYVHKYAYGP